MCSFCEIADGRTEAVIVLDDSDTVAFLDHRPLFHGHSLLIPKRHYPTLIDLPVGLVEPLFHRARLLAEAMERGLGAHGSFVAVNNRVSQSVPHLHIHVVPRRFKDGLRGFFWPRTRYTDDAHMREVGGRLRAAVDALRT